VAKIAERTGATEAQRGSGAARSVVIRESVDRGNRLARKD